MTMLDRMRRHKGWLKWSLALVVLTFVWLYIPAEYTGLNQGMTPAGNRLATIDAETISVSDFQRRYRAQIQAYRASYGGKVTDEILQQMGVPQQVLQQMIQEKAELTEAERAGITVSDAEVRVQIMAIPGLQENGQFIGEERYTQLLAQQNPPITPSVFEASVREGLILDKFRAGLTEWMSVSDTDLESEYKRRNEKVTLDVVSVLADNFKTQANPTDAEISAHFDKNKESYRIPDAQGQFVRVNPPSWRRSRCEGRRQRNYNARSASTRRRADRASHILLTTSKDDAAVRAQAGRC
jgi:peptidyl-prolyl cis-trans isomerase D